MGVKTYTFLLYDTDYENIDYTSGYQLYIARTKTNEVYATVKAESKEEALQKLISYAKENKPIQERAKLINISIGE